MKGLLLVGGLLFAVVISLIAGTPPSAEESFADVVEKFVVYRNGEVVLDVRILMQLDGKGNSWKERLRGAWRKYLRGCSATW